jgi:predicted ribonuclease YlaK
LYKYYWESLPIVKQCRDLGVIIPQNLQPGAHINAIVAKVHQTVNAIHRCFVSRDVNLRVRAYIVYVRPLVEYNSVVWLPYLEQDIGTLEGVQRCFA